MVEVRLLIVSRFLYLGVLVTLFSGLATSQEKQKMDDPLFAIRYDPSSVHFESLPASLVNQCKSLKGRYNDAWVYGHAKAPDAEYFLVSGLMKYFDDPPTGKPIGHIAPDETGLIVALSGSTCAAKAQDGLEWIKDSAIWNVSEATFNNLVADVFRRYSDAFGGKSKFLKNIPSNRHQYLLPELRSRLEAFEKQP